VVYLQADVSEPQQAEYLVSETRRRFGKINGMIHAAGVLRDSFIIKKNRAEIDAVLAAKVFGTFYLDKALGNEDLDFFVLFSSLASTMGNAGQCDYAYANYFLDSFARLRDRLCREGRRRGRTLSINWPPWRRGGMKIDANVEKVGFKKLGLALLETGEGFEAFDKALAADMPQVALVKAKRSIITRILNLQPPQEPAAPGNEISAAIMALDTEQAAEELETVLEKLGI
jgi:polyketide synthase PksN